MKKKMVYLCIVSLLSVLLLAGCKKNTNKNNPNYNSDNYLNGTHYAVIEVENYGDIYLELNADEAPATVTNFVNLTMNEFYNGLTFHRIISDFMIQGGDPNGNSTGGSAYTVPGEFAANGHNNTISHVRGTISMARTEDYNSASSQFFIVHQDHTDLDGNYAAFGRVVSGMDVVDTICLNALVEDANGTVLAENQPVISSVTMINKADVPVSNIVEEENKEEEPQIPDPVSKIEIFTVSNPENMEAKERWNINEDADTYFLKSDTDLLSLALYQIDLTQDSSYTPDNMIAYSSDIGADTYIALQINIPREGLPTQLLVGEEHTGALRMYLLAYDENANEAYLVPFMN